MNISQANQSGCVLNTLLMPQVYPVFSSMVHTNCATPIWIQNARMGSWRCRFPSHPGECQTLVPLRDLDIHAVFWLAHVDLCRPSTVVASAFTIQNGTLGNDYLLGAAAGGNDTFVLAGNHQEVTAGTGSTGDRAMGLMKIDAQGDTLWTWKVFMPEYCLYNQNLTEIAMRAPKVKR